MSRSLLEQIGQETCMLELFGTLAKCISTGNPGSMAAKWAKYFVREVAKDSSMGYVFPSRLKNWAGRERTSTASKFL
jgi:hypothetical protein